MSNFVRMLDTQSVTIASGQTVSSAVDVGGAGNTVVGIYFPTMTGTTVTFQGSSDGTTYSPYVDDAGDAIAITVSNNSLVQILPTKLLPIRYIKVVSGSSEAADRTIKLSIRPV